MVENENEKENGVYVKVSGEEQEQSFNKNRTETLYDVLHRLVFAVLFPEPDNTEPLLHRLKICLAQNAPLIPEASRNTARHVLLWTRCGTPLRPLLVIPVGTITLVALTALLVFMLFFLAATINAIVISLLISLAVAGGFLALFFAFVTAIYIGALSVAIFAVSTATFWAIVAILITTGWIGFFYTVWLVTRKSIGFAKRSLSVTGSAISTYTAARHARHLLHEHSDQELIST